MKPSVRALLLTCTLLLIAGLMVFAAACGSSATTTTTAAPTQTTAAATDTTAVAATSTTAAATTTSAAAAASGTIAVKGLVDNPTTLTVDSLKKMNVVTLTANHPKLGPTAYTGVRFSDILTLLSVQSAAKVVDMICADGYIAEVSLADIKAAPDAMVAMGKDGTLNAVMPGMTGKAWATDIVTMQFK